MNPATVMVLSVKYVLPLCVNRLLVYILISECRACITFFILKDSTVRYTTSVRLGNLHSHWLLRFHAFPSWQRGHLGRFGLFPRCATPLLSSFEVSNMGLCSLPSIFPKDYSQATPLCIQSRFWKRSEPTKKVKWQLNLILKLTLPTQHFLEFFV